MKIKRLVAMVAALVCLSTPVEADPEAGLVKLDGHTIEYFSQGKGDVVIMMTGRTLSAGYLEPLAKEIAKQGHWTIIVNRRGAGQSTGSLENIDYHTHAKDVRDLLRALDITHASILGHALGGRIARTMAADYPNIVSSVILLAVGDVGKEGTEDPEQGRAIAKLFQPNSTELEIKTGMAYMVGDPNDVDRVWKVLAPSRYTNPDAIRSEARITTPREEWWAPPGITYLVVQGLLDKSAPPENAHRFIADINGRASLVELPGIGHLSPIEAPQIVANAVALFLE